MTNGDIWAFFFLTCNFSLIPIGSEVRTVIKVRRETNDYPKPHISTTNSTNKAWKM